MRNHNISGSMISEGEDLSFNYQIPGNVMKLGNL